MLAVRETGMVRRQILLGTKNLWDCLLPGWHTSLETYEMLHSFKDILRIFLDTQSGVVVREEDIGVPDQISAKNLACWLWASCSQLV